MYSLLFYMYYYVLIYFFYVFFYFVYLFFLHLYIEWRVMSPCSMQVWPRFSSRVSHNNPHQLGHSRPGLYHYLFLFLFIFLGKKNFFSDFHFAIIALRAGSCANDFLPESVLALNKKLKVNGKFQFFFI